MHRRWLRIFWGEPLVRRSFEVIGDNPRLMLFPVLLCGAIGLAAGAILLPLALYPSGQGWLTDAHFAVVAGRLQEIFWRDADGLREGWAYGYLAWVYFAAAFSTTFCNVAFYHETMRALSGDGVSVRRGLAAAGSRIRAILSWSMLTATVGLILRLIADRLGAVGRHFSFLGGLSWSVAAVFVVPVMINEPTANPFVLLRGSVRTLRQTWTDAVLGYYGIAGRLMLLLLGWMLAIGAIVLLGAFAGSWSAWIIVGGLLIGFAGLMLAILALNAAQNVFRSALYIYATEGVVPGPFTQAQLDASWRVCR